MLSLRSDVFFDVDAVCSILQARCVGVSTSDEAWADDDRAPTQMNKNNKTPNWKRFFIAKSPAPRDGMPNAKMQIRPKP
jgi:hypothetical protein